MRMLSGRMHWLTVGLALLVSAQGFTTKRLQGQAPLKPAGLAAQRLAEVHDAYAAQSVYGAPPGRMQGGMMPPGMMQGGVMPAGGMMMPDRPMSMSFAGPPPMEVAYASAHGPGSAGCQTCGGAVCGGRGCGCPSCGGGMCGGLGCGLGGAGSGCLFPGFLGELLGPLGPYAEGSCSAMRYFDIYAGTIGLQRTSDFGGFATGLRDPITGEFATTYITSTIGAQPNPVLPPTAPAVPVLRSSDLNFDKLRYGLEVIANLQVGPGSNVEARYFGLNNWNSGKTTSPIPRPTADLYSVYSLFGAAPPNGFVDTDRSFVHRINYESELNSGEVNLRRRFEGPLAWLQGSMLAGVRYVDLDEQFSFNAIGGPAFTFVQMAFFNQDTITRNQLTGFQVGGDLWANLAPGIKIGAETKGGIFGNHAEVESQIVSNSIPRAREFLQDSRTAYLAEFTASAVYRLTYSWSVKTSYNLLYVDNVALAPENYNTRDLSNVLGSGTGAFTVNRFPFLNIDGEVLYQGWSIGGEFLW